MCLHFRTRLHGGAGEKRALLLQHCDYSTARPVCQVRFFKDSARHCRSTIHLGQSKKKRMRDRVSCAKVELPHRNLAKGDHISHEQEYNTGHGIPAISHEVRRKIRRQPRQSEIQQEPVVHLLLEAALGWKCGIPCLSVQAAHSHPNQHTEAERKLIRDMRRRNQALGMIELWHRLPSVYPAP